MEPYPSLNAESFATFHNRHSGASSKTLDLRHATLTRRDSVLDSIENEYEDSTSPTGSARHSSGPDEVVFDHDLSHHSSPRTSNHSDDNESSSSFLSGPLSASCPPDTQDSSPYTTPKRRSPFRNSSSVRNMQMETTPPPYLPSPASRTQSMFHVASRNGTPRSARSAHSGMRISPTKMSPMKRTMVKKEYPLVLLHVTLLPIPSTYSVEVMEQLLPTYLLENWKVLREKATDTVLERGILIPHPKEDYDLLEERLLESLDLKTPRILKCGHFHLDPDEEADLADSDTDDFIDEDNDADICEDCGKRVRDGRYGSGTGSRRWDIKVYAANGLMRAGAWGAAWRVMERVDVEIIPWMDEEVKRELALRTEEERKHAALLQEASPRREDQQPVIDEERMREIYGNEFSGLAESREEHRQSPTHNDAANHQRKEVPLQNLLMDYLLSAAQDRKNIAIFMLSMFVLYLSMAWRSGPSSPSVLYHPTVSSPASSLSSPASLLSTSTGFPTAFDPSTVEGTEKLDPSLTAVDDTEILPSEASETSVQDIMDSLEARFEFAGE
ncbi:MAG: hypothetical protein Q9220_000892 [cf. Caloplaca sp. 1 TL-2023]